MEQELLLYFSALTGRSLWLSLRGSGDNWGKTVLIYGLQIFAHTKSLERRCLDKIIEHLFYLNRMTSVMQGL